MEALGAAKLSGRVHLCKAKQSKAFLENVSQRNASQTFRFKIGTNFNVLFVVPTLAALRVLYICKVREGGAAELVQSHYTHARASRGTGRNRICEPEGRGGGRRTLDGMIEAGHSVLIYGAGQIKDEATFLYCIYHNPIHSSSTSCRAR
jgi:hypothetical protein